MPEDVFTECLVLVGIVLQRDEQLLQLTPQLQQVARRVDDQMLAFFFRTMLQPLDGVYHATFGLRVDQV